MLKGVFFFCKDEPIEQMVPSMFSDSIEHTADSIATKRYIEIEDEREMHYESEEDNQEPIGRFEKHDSLSGSNISVRVSAVAAQSLAQQMKRTAETIAANTAIISNTSASGFGLMQDATYGTEHLMLSMDSSKRMRGDSGPVTTDAKAWLLSQFDSEKKSIRSRLDRIFS
eukprot:TRINITY_DN4979_c0_g1_i12.p1 TRINITY_DN4979_c0_g1~~TRINITY_DN4979_c0_g1_i12.p1  ORF type:complete len:170 (-),score=30.84 TRINITY_DN4979_c0_g1_i12:191-700(-)